MDPTRRTRLITAVTATALAVSLVGPGSAQLNHCSDCLLDDGDDGDSGPTTFAVDVTVRTEEETTNVTVDTDLERTDAWFDGSTGTVETVEDTLTMDLNPLDASLTVLLNNTVHGVLAAATPYHYTSMYLQVVAQNATKSTDCKGESAWEAHYLDYDEEQVTPKADHTVNVTWDYLKHPDGKDHKELEWNSSWSGKSGNPVVHNGSETWDLSPKTEIDHYHVYYNMSVDGSQLRGTRPFEIGSSAYCTG